MKISNVLFIFTVLLIGFYFLACGLLGQNGYLYNQSLKKLLIQRQYTKDKITLELESLVQRQISLGTDQGFKDIANSLGYYVDGDNVYLFSDTSKPETVFAGNVHDTEVTLFSPFSKGLCFVIALLLSSLISFIVWLVSYLVNRNYEQEDINYEDSMTCDIEEDDDSSKK